MVKIMPGFLGKIGQLMNQPLFSQNKNSNLINNLSIINDLYIEQRTINKFQKDKVFVEDNDFFVLTEGVILNSLDLIEKYKGGNLFETIILMYKLNGNEFFKEFRGSFSGAFFDKKKNKKIIYTNHIGDKPIYYSKLNNQLIFGSEINYILEYYKNNNIPYVLDREGAYFLLTYGYMIEKYTLFKEIYKLLPGHYILMEDGDSKILPYYKFDNTPIDTQTEIEILENIDFLFRKAITSAFEKDLEYNYKHLVGLSGGLDSRMTTWVAHDLGYGDNIVNFTFSQSDYLDESISKQIAVDLKHEWIFKTLDHGIFLKNIENVVKVNLGSSLYYGLSLGKSFLDYINLDEFGIVHTGQVGGILKGYYNNGDILKMSGMFSSKLMDKVNNHQYINQYKNEGEFLLYNRQLNGTLQGNLPYQERAETVSPFLDIDLVNYCLKIPHNYKKNELFIKWMVQYYPKSANYIWEETNGKVTDKVVTILGREVILKKLPNKLGKYVLRKLKMGVSSLENKNHMNPYDFWYDTNQDLKTFIEKYYYQNINKLDFDRELKNDCEYLFSKGTNIEKGQVLTLLAVLKLYF